MKHFLKIAEGVDVLPVIAAIARQPELWNVRTVRTAHPGSAHSQADDILVWFNEITDDVSQIADDRQTEPYPAWTFVPQVRALVFDLMRRVEGVQLGRVIITRLKPGTAITPHVDGGAPATFYTRFQIALQSLPGVVFRVGDETVNMRSGECWFFDNTQEHEVVNNSADDRLALIIDVRCA